MTCERARAMIIDRVIAEMMGPGSELKFPSPVSHQAQFEMISENPRLRYVVGILYPQRSSREVEDQSTEGQEVDSRAETDELLDIAATTANQYYPSSLGVSFYASGLNPALTVNVRAARYRRLAPEECRVDVDGLEDVLNQGLRDNRLFVEHMVEESGVIRTRARLSEETRNSLLKLNHSQQWRDVVFKLFALQNDGWQRIPIGFASKSNPDNLQRSGENEITLEIPRVGNLQSTEKHFRVCDGLKMVCIRRPDAKTHATLFTLALINEIEGGSSVRTEDCFFQATFLVKPKEASVRFLDYERLPRHTTRDAEQVSLGLLYRNHQVFGVGHGCAVCWNQEGTVLETKVIPQYEAPGFRFNVAELEPIAHIFSMQNLSDLSPLTKDEIIRDLRLMVDTYSKWIEKQRAAAKALDEPLKSTAEKHLKQCTACAERLMSGAELLKDPEVFLAFQLANRAMLMQRAHTLLHQTPRRPAEDGLDWPVYHKFPQENATWRPFQMAFILLNLKGISDPESLDRNLVDLIWIPTGGGKTEAYLGVSAFLIFLRRIRHKESGKGTAIIMRYTLRLLTAQQFQRASTLICACEIIRRSMPHLLGNSRISLGLWIGSSSTPNTVSEAADRLDSLEIGVETDNPFQVLSCPWCGTVLEREKSGDISGYEIRSRPKRFVVHCTEKTCGFHDELPVQVVDEDIYREPPTLLFATVDKFALLPWRQDVRNLFGLSSDCRSPELIVQDELHLISGPLGTIVGLYETAVDLLCSAKGIPPKIIASTATIRRAAEQIRGVYNREVRQFPEAGLNAQDSFFTREKKAGTEPGRLYVGIMATGKTLTTTQIRLMGAVLQYVYELDCEPSVKDPYWTFVGYFNTIRELGRTATFAQDAVKDEIGTIARRRNRRPRAYVEVNELTGARASADIPSMLERLAVRLPDRNVLDLLLASSMISVGIDIDRLGLMTVVGQPKSTSEYIQATSRIGRKYPGLILVLYDGARPRDRSHYERFGAYHQAFYRHVEPTSVTPFSGPARERALHAVLVSLVRHLIDELSADSQAINFRPNHEALPELLDWIVKRVKGVMPGEVKGTIDDLQELVKEWSHLGKTWDSLTYSFRRGNHLLYPAHQEQGQFWKTMQSMRNVDAPTNIIVTKEDWGIRR